MMPVNLAINSTPPGTRSKKRSSNLHTRGSTTLTTRVTLKISWKNYRNNNRSVSGLVPKNHIVAMEKTTGNWMDVI